MRKHHLKLILVQLLVLPLALFAAEDEENPMSLYKDNYFVVGPEEMKFRISAKYNLLSPMNIGLYYAYSGIAFWDIYSESAPFREWDHNPELFIRITEGKNIFKNSSLGIADYFKIGAYEHMSNGKEGPSSRAWDRYFGEIQFSFGEQLKYGIRLKGWNYYNIADENEDLTKYLGYGEGEIFIRHPISDTRLYFKGGPGTDLTKGWMEAGLTLQSFTKVIQPNIYLQFYHGYGESLTDYNKKSTMLRLGIVFFH